MDEHIATLVTENDFVIGDIEGIFKVKDIYTIMKIPTESGTITYSLIPGFMAASNPKLIYIKNFSWAAFDKNIDPELVNNYNIALGKLIVPSSKKLIVDNK